MCLQQKMIHSLFLINSSGDIFLEKHWKSLVSQSVCDYFFEAQERAADAENVPPVIPTPHHYLISIYRDKIFFVSVIQTEVPPLFVIEFLHRVADTFQVCPFMWCLRKKRSWFVQDVGRLNACTAYAGSFIYSFSISVAHFHEPYHTCAITHKPFLWARASKQ